MTMLEDLFGSGYQFVPLRVEPADAGHRAVGRLRTYIYIFPVARTAYLHDAFDLYSRISRAITKVVATQGRDYMVACRLTRLLDHLDLSYSRNVGYNPATWQRCI